MSAANTLAEHAHTMLGVEGRMFQKHVADAAKGTWINQTFKAMRYYKKGANNYRITVELRFDDSCGNGHNTFSITCDQRRQEGVYWREDTGGAAHDLIVEQFPEFAPLIKWHLTSSDGPLHYIANTVYFAGDRDHNGLLKGEVRQIRNGKTGLPCWKLTDSPLPKHVDAPECPTETYKLHYVPWNTAGEGKERQLDVARRAAVWLDATDEELTAPGLKQRLEARHGALLAAFRADMEAAGFLWAPTQSHTQGSTP